MRQLLFLILMITTSSTMFGQDLAQKLKNEIKEENQVYLEFFTDKELGYRISDSLAYRELIALEYVESLQFETGLASQKTFLDYRKAVQNSLKKKGPHLLVRQNLKSFMAGKKIFFGEESASSKEWAQIYQKIGNLGPNFVKGYRALLKFESRRLSKQKLLEKINSLKAV